MNTGFVDRNRPQTREFAGAAPENPDFSRDCVTVSELNGAVAQVLNRVFPLVWVKGEISNLTRASSGHLYFNLKDAKAQVRCVMFRHRTNAIGFVPKEGDKVEVRATVSLYEPRGDFQLNAEFMRRAGAGDLFQAFVELKMRLEAEGLFAPERKKALPAQVCSLGVITSLQAAALRDVLTTLQLRAPQVRVVIYPSLVQGAEAPAALRAALQKAVQRQEVDALLLVRGGGSIEDLWAFNDEALARQIAACPIPLISGVGHETDFTIADFVADYRAATPTAAATAATPDRRATLREVAARASALVRAIRQRWERQEQRLDLVMRLLRSPADHLQVNAARLKHLQQRLNQSMASRLGESRWRLQVAAPRLQVHTLSLQLRRQRLVAEQLVQRLQRALSGRRSAASKALEGASAQLALISPLAILERGYALVHTAHDASMIKRAAALRAGQKVSLQFADGSRAAVIEPEKIARKQVDEGGSGALF
jgi:exodeoxyribonuclease VII large subunit